jgi:hypothetical protein
MPMGDDTPQSDTTGPPPPEASVAPPADPPEAAVPTMNLLAPETTALTASGGRPEGIILVEPSEPPADD